MKVLDTLPVDLAKNQSIPSVGLLKSFGKPDSKAPGSFQELLRSESDAASGGAKLTAGAALLARRNIASNGSSEAGDPTDPSNTANPPTEGDPLVADSAPVAVPVSDTEAEASVNVPVPAGLDPSDIALEAAAIAAALQFAAPPVVEPQPTIDGQVSIRIFQAACRPSVTSPEAPEAPADGMPVLIGAPSVIDALPLAGQVSVQESQPTVSKPLSGDTKIGEAKVLSPLPQSSSVTIPTNVPVTLVDDLTQNVNLLSNQVVEAVVAYSRAAQVLAEPLGSTVSEEKGVSQSLLGELGDAASDAPSSVGANVPVAALVPVSEEKRDSLTASDDQPHLGSSIAQEQDADFGVHNYAKIVNPIAVNTSAASRIVPDNGPEPTAANIAKLYSEPGVEEVGREEADSSPVLASDDASRSGDVKVSSPDLSVGVLPAHTSVMSEVQQKPVLEGARQVHGNVELWKTIGDAVQRVRSENPRHLSMELRLGDGSSVNLELRMGAAGIEASFKSESQGLLRALQNQWSAFVERSSSEPVKIASTVFEGRTGPDLSGSGGDAQERRQAFEDAADTAALSWQAENFSVELPPETERSLVNTSGRLNIYA